MRDNLDRLNQNLEALIELVQTGGFGGKTVNIGQDALDGSNGPDLHSTGEAFAELTLEDANDGGEFKRIELGGPKEVVSVRTDTTLLVAFNRPVDGQADWIPVRPQDSPFTLGGDTALNASNVFLKFQSDSDAPANYHVTAH